MVTVTELRAYLNLPPDITDTQLSMWLKAAKSEARSAGVPDFQRNAHYDLFILALAAWFYDNRGMQVSGTYQSTALETMQSIKNSFVLELRHATEDPEEESSDNPEDPEDPENPEEGGDGG